jgi:hypothetical protein
VWTKLRRRRKEINPKVEAPCKISQDVSMASDCASRRRPTRPRRTKDAPELVVALIDLDCFVAERVEEDENARRALLSIGKGMNFGQGARPVRVLKNRGADSVQAPPLRKEFWVRGNQWKLLEPAYHTRRSRA